MTKVRGFEKITSYKDVDFPLPSRQTARSAGYDIYLPERVILPAHTQKMVPTGIKAYMAVKRHLRLVNNEGIVDADYYNNPDNEGHLLLALYNDSDSDVTLEKGERVAQGIFYTYLLADDDARTPKKERSGGFGSTSK